MKTTLKTLAILIAMLLTTGLSASAQTINIIGKVEDEFLKVGLMAHVSIHNTDSTVVVDSAKVVPLYGAHNRIATAHFYAAVPNVRKDYLVKASLDGYGDVWQRVSVTDADVKEVETPTLKMRKMRTINLDDVVVTATKVKMFYRGDTLIYDADAFKLPDGSMLDDLIRQMPGVRMNEQGEIFVNDRKIDELLLGSRSFMKGNKKVLLENLPYYTVKNVKVYDKTSDRDEALGTHLDAKKFVMDVNLRQEYQKGYIGNVEAAVGTQDRWLGRGFLLGFNDLTRYTLLANANNVNESRHIGQSGHWTPASMPREMLTTRSVKGEIDYQSHNKVVKDVLGAEFTSTSGTTDMMQHKETFLDGRSPFSEMLSAQNRDSWKLQVNNSLTLTKPAWMVVTADLTYGKYNGNSGSTLDHYDDSLTTAMRTKGMSEGHDLKFWTTALGSINMRDKSHNLTVSAAVNHNESESQTAMRYSTENRIAQSTEVRHNSTDFSNSNTGGKLGLYYSKTFADDNTFTIDNVTTVDDSRTHDYLIHPDTLTLASRRDAFAALTDPQNSYDSRQTNWQNTVKFSYVTYYKYDLMPGVQTGYIKWNFSLELPLISQRLDYQRAALDTLARQTKLFANPSIRYHAPLFKGEIKANAKLETREASLTDRISFTDTRSPLVTLLGNPDLKPIMNSDITIEYSQRGKNQLQWNLGGAFNYSHRNVAQSLSYNPQNGIYTYKPQNVSGAYTASATGGYSKALDKNRHWTIQTNADANFHHSIDHSMLVGETTSHENAVNTLTLHDGAYIQYNKGALNLRATGDIRWRHSEGKMRDFSTLNATDFQYGLNARYTLPVLKTTVSADANMYSRRGYGSSNLNTDDFVVNASLSQPFLKGKLIARLEAFDLLHNLSSTQYEVNAQGRTETFYRSLPHYVMAHLVYHWNKNPKKK